MTSSFILVLTFYLGCLVVLARTTKLKKKNTKNYLLAGKNTSLFLGLLTTAATLFSAFTMIGMPDFFRQHGIGAWIFLALADAMMVYLLVRLGPIMRSKARSTDYQGMAGFMRSCYKSKLAGYVTFVGALIFLIPYISVQIRGVSFFLDAAFPNMLSSWLWSVIILVVILLYSETGGLKAIMYNDALQGLILFVVIWIIGFNCLSHFGSPAKMFEAVNQVESKLLSVPGPKGLFTTQFFIISAVSIMLLPYTQPQISTRIVIMKNVRALKRMAIGLGSFALLVILPTLFMGMYGAVNYPEMDVQGFIGQVLLYDQLEVVGALALIGLIAAAVSTSDSQLFALGTELRSIIDIEDDKALKITRIFIVILTILVLIFTLLSSDHLVLLARLSFSGTALMGPLIILGIFGGSRDGYLLAILTGLAQLAFILASLGLAPAAVMGLSMEILLFIGLSITAIVLALKDNST